MLCRTTPRTARSRSRPATTRVSASLACRREVHDAIGGWDERFGAAADDVAFSLAAQRAGYRIGFAEDAVCHYRVRTTLRGVLAQQWRYGRGLATLNAWCQTARTTGCQLTSHGWRPTASGMFERSDPPTTVAWSPPVPGSDSPKLWG